MNQTVHNVPLGATSASGGTEVHHPLQRLQRISPTVQVVPPARDLPITWLRCSATIRSPGTVKPNSRPAIWTKLIRLLQRLPYNGAALRGRAAVECPVSGSSRNLGVDIKRNGS